MRRLVAVASIIVAVAVASSAAAQTPAFSLTLTTRPSPLGLGQNLFEVLVKDAKGQPVANADVSLVLVMPADPKTKHPEMRTEGKLNNVGAGKYNGIAMVTMAGDWDVTVAASRRGKELARKTQRLTAYLKAPAKTK
jgi:nitrogen fixation protein FixH